jgi:hypothetical protein
LEDPFDLNTNYARLKIQSLLVVGYCHWHFMKSDSLIVICNALHNICVVAVFSVTCKGISNVKVQRAAHESSKK